MRLLPVFLLLALALAGCDQFAERATRREVLKLAYRTSQFQEALERCEAPPEVLDYVVAHEAAHLVHMNHGPRFWALCAQLSPHTAAAKHWLAAHGGRLLRYG